MGNDDEVRSRRWWVGVKGNPISRQCVFFSACGQRHTDTHTRAQRNTRNGEREKQKPTETFSKKCKTKKPRDEVTKKEATNDEKEEGRDSI
jgi:hypothetical protein